jgi:hypothetical protein
MKRIFAPLLLADSSARRRFTAEAPSTPRKQKNSELRELCVSFEILSVAERPNSVIPATAGIQVYEEGRTWISAYAEMTIRESRGTNHVFILCGRA